MAQMFQEWSSKEISCYMNIRNNKNLHLWNFVTYFYVFFHSNKVCFQTLTIPIPCDCFGFPSSQDPPLFPVPLSERPYTAAVWKQNTVSLPNNYLCPQISKSEKTPSDSFKLFAGESRLIYLVLNQWLIRSFFKTIKSIPQVWSYLQRNRTKWTSMTALLKNANFTFTWEGSLRR